MVNIYTSYCGDNIIDDNEAFFTLKVSAKGLDDNDYQVIKAIDNAEVVDRALGTVKTPNGVTSIDSLSTGCKTVLNYRYIKKNKLSLMVDATECGWNALEELFKQVEGYNTNDKIVLRHCDSLFKCTDRQYKINGEKIVDTSIDLALSI